MIKTRCRNCTGTFLNLIVLTFFLFLSACGSSSTSSPTPDSLILTDTPGIQITDTPAPTATVRPRVVLIVGPGSDPQSVDSVESLVARLAADSGLEFSQVTTLSAAEIMPDTRVVVVLGADPGLAALTSAAPGTKFLTLGIPGLQPADNLYEVSSEIERPDQAAFLAGYLASLVTPDWRAAVLHPASTSAGSASRLGFTNGAVFFCGLCRPAYPPFVQYPLSFEFSPGSEGAVVDALVAQGVQTVYLAPGVGGSSLIEALVEKDIKMIGSESPPVAVPEHWIATIQSDWLAGLQNAWIEVVEGGQASPAQIPLMIVDRNSTLLSDGRLRLVEQLANDLAAGLIDTGVDPQTGEAK